jgi:hypothetical protein
MAWIESHQELGRHPKTKRLGRSLGISTPTVIGHLHLLWWWSLDFAQDGSLDGFDAAEIADAAMWEGDPVPFYAALVAAGFIDGDECDHYRLHDWDDYAGKLLDRRKSNATRQKTWRDRHRNESTAEAGELPNASVTVTSPLRNGATVPNRTVPDQEIKKTPTVSAAKTPPTDRPDLRKPKEREKGWIEHHPLFDTVAEVFGRPAPSQWSSLAMSLKDLDAFEATPDELRRRASVYPAVMGTAADGTPITMTLLALVKHWHLCAGKPVLAGSNGHRAPPIPPRPKAESDELRRRILAGEDIE